MSIIGTGRLGSALAYSIIPNPLVDEIMLYDSVPGKSDGVSLDISHAYPEFAGKMISSETSSTAGSKIIVITAGVARTSEMSSRADLLQSNKKIIEDVIGWLDLGDDTILIIATNPVEEMCHLAHSILGISPNRILGFGSSLDSKRMQCIISKKTSVPSNKISCMVIGEHGSGMIPLFSHCVIDGSPASDYNLDENDIEHAVKDTSSVIIKSVGGTEFGPAHSLAEMIDAILSDSKTTMAASVFTSGEYGINGVFVSLPVKVGIDGVIAIEKFNLSENEKSRLSEVSKKLTEEQSAL